MKPNLKDFPKLGNETKSHIELCEILEKVAEWKEAFEEQLKEVIKIYHPARGEVALAKEILGEGEKE